MAQHNICYAFPGRDAVTKSLDSSFYFSSPEARHAVEQASEYVHADLYKIGYLNKDILPKWQTILLVTHCYSIYLAVKEIFGEPMAFAGYSQGEFSACTAAGVFTFPEVLGLIGHLEQLLQSKIPENECMYRLINIDITVLEKCCKEIDPSGNDLCVSAYISETQNIISGKRNSVEAAIHLLKKRGARWAIDLHSDRAYHSPLCNTAATKAKKFFDEMDLYDASAPVYSCCDGTGSMDRHTIRNKLAGQINHPLHWGKIVDGLTKNCVTEILELGPGCTVSANSRLADKNVKCRWIGCTRDI